MAVGARKSAPTRPGSYGSGAGHRKMPSWERVLRGLCCGSILARKMVPAEGAADSPARAVPNCGRT
eukprot:805417-Heterocapsa_arctica.AAC.1